MYWIYSMLRKSMKEKCHVAKDFNFLKDYTKCPYFRILQFSWHSSYHKFLLGCQFNRWISFFKGVIIHIESNVEEIVCPLARY